MQDTECRNWETMPIDHVCDLLRERPELVEACPDAVWRKFRLGHWAKLVREEHSNSNYPVIANHKGRLAVVDKMKELGVAAGVGDGKDEDVLIGGFAWCCPFHWAEEYGSVFHVFPAALPKEEKIKYTAESTAMNPHGNYLGHGGRYSSDIPKHIQWLAAMAADFAAMSAEAAVSAPEYAEEYAIIALAAEYEIRALKPDAGMAGARG